MASIILLIPDLFFSVRVADAARMLGYETREVGDAAALLAVARQGAAGIILDTQERSDWQAAVRQIKVAPETAAIPILAFGSHVDVALQRAAVQAGCDRLVTRGKLMQELPDLLQQLFTSSGRAP
jgi:CheY-like chemotaxis protein